MTKPDYPGYAEALEIVAEGVQKDYWTGVIDINRHQLSVVRTYLWVSAALLGAYAAAFDRYYELISITVPAVWLSIVRSIAAALAFGVSLYAIPPRKGYRSIPDSGWGQFSRDAYEILKSLNPTVRATFLTAYIAKVDVAYAHNMKTNKVRAKMLRIASWLLIASFSFASFAAIVVASANYDPAIMEENSTMSGEDQGDNNTPTNQSTEPVLSVPEPPPPADTGGSDISTHAQQPITNANRVFITDSVKPKE